MNRRATKSRTRRLKWMTGIAVVVIVLVCLAAYAAFAARSRAEKALADFEYVQHNLSRATSVSGRATLEAQLRNARNESTDANNALYSTGILHALSWVPFLGGEITGASSLFSDSALAATSGLNLLHSVDALQTRDANGNISNASLIALQRSVTSARSTFATLQRPVGHLFGPVGHERAVFDQKVSRVRTALTNALNGLTVVRSLFGNGATSTVLVLPENNAEMRDQGTILSYSLMQVRGSSISVLRSGSVSDINLTRPLDVPSSLGTKTWFYPNGANEIFQSVNATADFSWTGATAAAMFEKSTGIHVDDVIALDVPAMAALVGVTGPLTVPGLAAPLSEANFSTVVLHDLYAEYPVGNQIPRKTELNDIASTLLQRLRSTRGDQLAILRALAGQIPGRHLLLWSASPGVERAITELGASGKLDTTLADRTFHLAVESDVAAKLDYYMRVSENFDFTLTQGGDASVVTTVTERNAAPAGQAPSYQLGPDGINSHVAGEYVSNDYLWSPAGSEVPNGAVESGLELTGQSAVVMPQHSTSTVFTTLIPHAVKNGRFVLRLVPQSTLVPALVTVKVHGAGWRVNGPHRRAFPLIDSKVLKYDVIQTTG